MAGQFDEETQAALRDAFAAFDKQGIGRINEESFATIMQSFGHTVTESETRALVTQGQPGQPSGIEYSSLLQAMAKKAKGADNMENEVLEAFQVFDKDNDGFISEAELRHIMTHMGEPLTSAEVDEMIREANGGSGGNIDYRSFTRTMFG